MSSGEGNPAPGWYPDPVDSTGLRYWDGERWTVEQAPVGQPGQPPGAKPDQPTPPPRPLGTVQRVAIAGIVLAAIASVVSLLVSLSYADQVGAQLADGNLTLDDAEDANDAFSWAGVLSGAATIAAAIAFIVWFHRAYTNAAGLTGQQLRWGTGWAVGAWFVPIMWWWRPKQIANDVWRAGDPNSKENPQWNALPVPGMVHWWWALYVLAGVIGGVGGGMISPDAILVEAVNGTGDVSRSDLELERAAANVVAASGAFNVIAAAAAVIFIRQSSRRQDERIAASR
jgi:hypothetical protein